MGGDEGDEGNESDEGDEEEGDEEEQDRKGQEGKVVGVPRHQGEDERRPDERQVGEEQERQGGLEEVLGVEQKALRRQQGLLAGSEGARHQRLRSHWWEERTGQSAVRKGEGDLQGVSRGAGPPTDTLEHSLQ